MKNNQRDARRLAIRSTDRKRYETGNNRWTHLFLQAAVFLLVCMGLIILPVSCQNQQPTTQTLATSQTVNPSATSAVQSTASDPNTIASTINLTSQTATPTTSLLKPSRQMKVKVLTATLYQTASLTAPVLTEVSWLKEVGYISGPDAQGFDLVQTAEGLRGYCLAAQLAEQKDVLYAKVPEMTVLSVIPNYQGTAKKSQLVDVRQMDPSICIDLIFARKGNFTGVQQYERDICLLQQGTMTKLKQAQALFRKNGYSIKIYDAYRPYSITVKLAAFNGNATYLANPLTGSIHNKGAAVDMTVVDKKGYELEMPSLIHTMNATSSRSNPVMSLSARQNLDYVQSVMVKCGFLPYANEWWHYSDTSHSQYPHLDVSLATVEMVTALKLPTITPPPVRDPAKTGFVNVPIALVPTPTPTPSPKPTPTPKVTTAESQTVVTVSSGN